MAFLRSRTLDDILENWDEFKPSPPRLKGFAFLLYSSMDQNIARFVDTYCSMLDSMTGPDFEVFVLQQIDNFISRYSRKPDRPSEMTVSLITPLSAPIGASFDVVRYFSLDAEEVPCIIIFQNLHDEEVLVYPLDGTWNDKRLNAEFKAVSSVVQRALRKAGEMIGDDWTEETWDAAMAAFWKELTKGIKRRRRKSRVITIAEGIGNLLKQMKQIKDLVD